MSMLRPVAAAERLHNSNDFPAFFKTGLNEGLINKIRHQGVRCDEYVGPWDKNAHQTLGQLRKEQSESALVAVR